MLVTNFFFESLMISWSVDIEMAVLPEDPEIVLKREGVHERIQAEFYHETK